MTENSPQETCLNGAFLTSRGAERRTRKERQRDCQLVALGVILASGNKTVSPSEFLDSGIGGTVEMFREGTPSSKTAIEIWLRDSLGVRLNDGEKLFESILRTVQENTRREKASSLLYRLQKMCDGPLDSESEFLAMLKNEIADL